MWCSARRVAAIVVLTGLPLAACATTRRHRVEPSRTATSQRASSPRARPVVLGRSVRGRPITAVELRGRGARRTLLVVGCIHGDEAAGIAITRRLRSEAAVPGLDLWVVDDLNPDGVVAGSRQNAHGVDLNRNFPFRWRVRGSRGDQQYAGPRALSEPEARIAHALILRLRPAVTVWFHQPLGLVDESGGSLAVERRFARLAHLPLRRLARYPGSAAGWQDARLGGTTAFVVELPRARPSPPAVRRYSTALRRLVAATAVGSTR